MPLIGDREVLDFCVTPPPKRGGPYVGTPTDVDRAILHYMLEDLRETLRGCTALSVEDLTGLPLRVTEIVEPLIIGKEGKE